MPVSEAKAFFDQLELDETDAAIAKRLLTEIRMRMALHRFLDGGMLDSKMTYCCLHIWTLEGKIHEGYFPFISQSVIIDVVSDMYVSGSFWVYLAFNGY